MQHTTILSNYVNVTQPRSEDDDDDDEDSCSVGALFFWRFRQAVLWASLVLAIVTLGLILGHRSLRKQQNIFAFNIVLADLLGIVSYFVEDFIDYLKIEVPEELYKYLAIVWNMSNFASILSILLVAVYQLILIRVDPLGTRHIITTPRCLAACVLTWAVASAIAIVGSEYSEDADIVPLGGAGIALVVTGTCYLLIYRAVTEKKDMRGGSEIHKRVLRTFAIVYVTTLVIWILISILVGTMIALDHVELSCDTISNLITLHHLLVQMNWIGNSAIYWWRLKEFRAILASCGTRWRQRRNRVAIELRT